MYKPVNKINEHNTAMLCFAMFFYSKEEKYKEEIKSKYSFHRLSACKTSICRFCNYLLHGSGVLDHSHCLKYT